MTEMKGFNIGQSEEENNTKSTNSFNAKENKLSIIRVTYGEIFGEGKENEI